jgi:hypothetical protein
MPVKPFLRPFPVLPKTPRAQYRFPVVSQARGVFGARRVFGSTGFLILSRNAISNAVIG